MPPTPTNEDYRRRQAALGIPMLKNVFTEDEDGVYRSSAGV